MAHSLLNLQHLHRAPKKLCPGLPWFNFRFSLCISTPNFYSPDRVESAYFSSSDQVFSSPLPVIFPWNFTAGHFEISQRPTRLPNLSERPILQCNLLSIPREGRSRRRAPSTSTASAHSGKNLPVGEPFRSPPFPDKTPLYTADGYFNLPQSRSILRPLTLLHQSTSSPIQQIENMINPRAMAAHHHHGLL